jgi:hypothetical protein
MVRVLELDHVAVGHGHQLGRHGWSDPGHVPGGIGLAERALRRQAIHSIDHVIAALCGGGAGSETDAMSRRAADDHRLDSVVFQRLIKVAAQELVGSISWFDHFTVMLALYRRRFR